MRMYTFTQWNAIQQSRQIMLWISSAKDKIGKNWENGHKPEP